MKVIVRLFFASAIFLMTLVSSTLSLAQDADRPLPGQWLITFDAQNSVRTCPGSGSETFVMSPDTTTMMITASDKDLIATALDGSFSIRMQPEQSGMFASKVQIANAIRVDLVWAVKSPTEMEGTMVSWFSDGCSVSTSYAMELEPPEELSRDCLEPSNTSIVVLDATSDGRFFRTDADGNALSTPFSSTDVWITGDFNGRVTLQVSPSAANSLKGNEPLTIENRTGNQICIDLDFSLAARELQTEVFVEDGILQFGRSDNQPVQIDLASIDMLTIVQPIFDLDRLLQEDIVRGILAAREDFVGDGTPQPMTCDAIKPDLDGALLRRVLNGIARQGHNPQTYAFVREALRDIDRDPANPENVVLFYTNRSQDRFTFSSDHTDLPDGDRWNREHLWPQSHGADEHETPRTDLHHIRATDASINSARSNQDFGEVPETGTNQVIDGTNDTPVFDTFDNSVFWEPRDDIKGDIARALFYMDIRYEGTDDEPDLVIVASDSSEIEGQLELGDLTALLLWHAQDPVSPDEIARHSAVVEFQGNVNPFIVCADKIDVTLIWP